MFDTLIVFPKEFFEKVDFDKNSTDNKKDENFPVGKQLKSVKTKSRLQKKCIPPAVSLPAGKFFMFLSSADFFHNQHFVKILSKIPSECQTVWIQIRHDILSGLIWIQTICKCYQQTALAGEEISKLPREYVGILKRIHNDYIALILRSLHICKHSQQLVLILCMLSNFSCFCCRLLTLFKINPFKIFFQEHY